MRGVLLLFAASVLAGCASHASKLQQVTDDLRRGDDRGALTRFLDEKEKPDDLLYLLERGYLEHAAGEYAASNASFEAAELRSEDLFTRSITNEAAALLTSDNAKPYRSYPYELVMIHYYRAFNYLELGRHDDALVEARKANRRLTELRDKKEGKSDYANDAFLQYFTGLLYASAGEVNDAAVSYRDALESYGRYESAYGIGAPDILIGDLHRALVRQGMTDEARQLAERHESIDKPLARADEGTVMLFLESGMLPYREPVGITLPIFDDDDDDYEDCSGCEWKYAQLLVNRYEGDIYSYRRRNLKVDHVLRFSFPEMIERPSAVATIEVSAPKGGAAVLAEGQPLGAIARRDFEERLPKVLLKTVARALVKEFARTRAKKKDKTLGVLVNIFNVATEQADTRGWVLLPGQIDIARVAVPAGSSEVEVVFRGGADTVLDRRTVPVDVAAGGMVFRRVRTYR